MFAVCSPATQAHESPTKDEAVKLNIVGVSECVVACLCVCVATPCEGVGLEGRDTGTAPTSAGVSKFLNT